MFGNKIKWNPNITLVEGNNLITDEKSLAKTFNHYFVNVVSNLGVNIIHDNSGIGDYSNYDNHPSIISIKQHITDKSKVFSFRKVTKEEISSAIKTQNRKNATLSNNIPTKIIQQFNERFTEILSNNFNSCLESGMLLDELKLTEVYQFLKRMIKRIKAIIGPSAFFLIFQKCTKDVSKHN